MNSFHCQSIQYFDALIHTATMSSMAVDCLVPSMTNPIAIPAASPVGREPHIVPVCCFKSLQEKFRVVTNFKFFLKIYNERLKRFQIGAKKYNA